MSPVIAEGNYLPDLLKFELENLQSREAVTVLSGQALAMGTVLGKVTKVIPATGTAGAGNTGNGLCATVVGGSLTKSGAYALACIEVPAGVVTLTAPATGTPGAGNTGAGTMTAVTKGADVKAGAYTMTCKTAPDNPAAGAQNIATPWAWNVGGSGVIASVTVGATAKVGKHTLSCIFVAVGASVFEVRDPNGIVIGQATEAVEFTGGGLTFTITDLNDFALGDGFDIDTVSDGTGGVWEILSPTGETLPPAEVGTAYVNDQINFTINDDGADFVVGDTFTVTVASATAAHNGGTFSVTDPDGIRLENATVAVAYANAHLGFTISDGNTDFVVGDTFTITVTAGSGYVKIIDFTAVDGSQDAFGFIIEDVTTVGSLKSIAFTSGGTYQMQPGDYITGATGAAVAQIVSVTLSSGSWAGGDAAGTLVLANVVGTFEAENLNVGTNLNVATIGGDAAAYYPNRPGVAIVRDAQIVADNLVWPVGASASQKAAALAQLAEKGIVNRDAV